VSAGPDPATDILSKVSASVVLAEEVARLLARKNAKRLDADVVRAIHERAIAAHEAWLEITMWLEIVQRWQAHQTASAEQ
jgi:hypothetical protein